MALDPVTGVYGGFLSMPQTALLRPNVCAARDKHGHDYYIKVIHCGPLADCSEAQVLTKLSSEPIKSDPCNPVVPLTTLLSYEEWTFAVLPRWGHCDDPPLELIGEGVEIGIQILQGIEWLHRNGIAHLHITNQHIVMNYLGFYAQGNSGDREFLRWCHPDIKYRFIGLSDARMYAPGSAESGTARADVYHSETHRAPEMDKGAPPYDPFRADIFMAGHLLLAMLHPLSEFGGGFIALLKDMVHEDPALRVSASEALRRFQEFADGVSIEDKGLARRFHWLGYLAWSKEERERDDVDVQDVGRNLREFMEKDRRREQERENRYQDRFYTEKSSKAV